MHHFFASPGINSSSRIVSCALLCLTILFAPCEIKPKYSVFEAQHTYGVEVQQREREPTKQWDGVGSDQLVTGRRAVSHCCKGEVVTFTGDPAPSRAACGEEGGGGCLHGIKPRTTCAFGPHPSPLLTVRLLQCD